MFSAVTIPKDIFGTDEDITDVPIDLIKDIREVISLATKCQAFRESVIVEEGGHVPMEIFNFWFHGKRTESSHFSPFFKWSINQLFGDEVSTMGDQMYPKVEETEDTITMSKLQDDYGVCLATKEFDSSDWYKETDHKKFEEKKMKADHYFSSIDNCPTSPQVNAMFLAYMFDRSTYMKSKKFSLWIHGQMPANNRDVLISRLIGPSEKDPGLLDLFANHLCQENVIAEQAVTDQKAHLAWYSLTPPPETYPFATDLEIVNNQNFSPIQAMIKLMTEGVSYRDRKYQDLFSNALPTVTTYQETSDLYKLLVGREPGITFGNDVPERCKVIFVMQRIIRILHGKDFYDGLKSFNGILRLYRILLKSCLNYKPSFESTES